MTEVSFEMFMGGLLCYLFSCHMGVMEEFSAACIEADERGILMQDLVAERTGLTMPDFLAEEGWLEAMIVEITNGSPSKEDLR